MLLSRHCDSGPIAPLASRRASANPAPLARRPVSGDLANEGPLPRGTKTRCLAPAAAGRRRGCSLSSTPVVSLRPSRACAAPGRAEAGRQVAATNGGCVIRTTPVWDASRDAGEVRAAPESPPAAGRRRTADETPSPRIEGKTRTRREGSRCGQSGSAHRSLLRWPSGAFVCDVALVPRIGSVGCVDGASEPSWKGRVRPARRDVRAGEARLELPTCSAGSSSLCSSGWWPLRGLLVVCRDGCVRRGRGHAGARLLPRRW